MTKQERLNVDAHEAVAIAMIPYDKIVSKSIEIIASKSRCAPSEKAAARQRLEDALDALKPLRAEWRRLGAVCMRDCLNQQDRVIKRNKNNPKRLKAAKIMRSWYAKWAANAEQSYKNLMDKAEQSYKNLTAKA